MARRIVIHLGRKKEARFRRVARKSQSEGMRLRYQIVLMYSEGLGCKDIARLLHCADSTASRVGRRFELLGEAGLIDGRSDPKATKVTDDYATLLADLLYDPPRQHGWRRTTWTRELLAKTMEAHTGESFSVASISRLLKKLGARKNRPRPTVACPWPRRKRQARLRRIQEILHNLPPGEVAVYEDEVDIHLNPKIGADWMLPGRQKTVLTPGQNEKRYVAGALDAATGHVSFVESDRKASGLFIQLLRHLAERVYPEARVIHVIVDNFSIHSSKRTQTAIRELEGRIVLHFLPPYLPEANRIERLWKDLHDNVTRNHRCQDMEELMIEVRQYLRSASPFPGSKPALARAC